MSTSFDPDITLSGVHVLYLLLKKVKTVCYRTIDQRKYKKYGTSGKDRLILSLSLLPDKPARNRDAYRTRFRLKPYISYLRYL